MYPVGGCAGREIWTSCEGSGPHHVRDEASGEAVLLGDGDTEGRERKAHILKEDSADPSDRSHRMVLVECNSQI